MRSRRKARSRGSDAGLHVERLRAFARTARLRAPDGTAIFAEKNGRDAHTTLCSSGTISKAWRRSRALGRCDVNEAGGTWRESRGRQRKLAALAGSCFVSCFSAFQTSHRTGCEADRRIRPAVFAACLVLRTPPAFSFGGSQARRLCHTEFRFTNRRGRLARRRRISGSIIAAQMGDERSRSRGVEGMADSGGDWRWLAGN